MEFKVLGPLEVTTGEGPLALGGRKQRLVLAHLITRANDVVATDVLIDEVWGEEPPDSVRSTLQGYVSHLRRALGERLEGRTPGYILHIEDGELDAGIFERTVRHAKQLLPSDPTGAAAAFAEALALWRGSAFADLADEPSLRGVIARLDELRLSATEHRISAELMTGGHSTVVSELEALTIRYPLRERMWANLMLALYRVGRQAEALSTYQRAREVLAEELGAEPSAELQRLHEQILRRDPILGRPERPRADVPPSRIDLQPDTEFAGYRIVRTLGRGGMSVVYLAEHEWLQRKVALKVLAPQLAEDERFRERFVRESRLAASLDHPNVIPIYEAGGSGADLFIAMRYVEGSDLRTLLHEAGKLEPDRAIAIVRSVAAALDAAHEQGLVHRDVKPGNVLLAEARGAGTPEHVYLSDFGLTKRSASDSGVTGTGQFVGTLDYAAPEQFQGGAPDGRTDVYSLGCVLFECLTGRPPFRADNDAGLMYAHLQEAPPAVTSELAELPSEIDRVIASAMAKLPAERQQSAGDLASEAAEALGLGRDAAPPAPRTPLRRLAPAIAVVIALAVGISVSAVIQGETPQAQDRGAVTIPSPAAEPVFATVERPLSSEEERLLGYLPSEAAVDCLPFDREGPAAILAALVCRPADMEVLYELFAERSSMDERFQLNANIHRAPDGECATDELAVSPYAVEGEPAGRVLCYTTKVEALGSRPDSSHIEWTAEDSAVYAHAVRSDLNDLTLYEWWLSSSGPVLTADGGTMVVAKDRPQVASGSPPGDGSYMVAGPDGCGVFESTCVMHLEGTTYDIVNVGDSAPIDRGHVSLRKPASIVFSPSPGFCGSPGRSSQPVTYIWSGSGDRFSFERTGGGRCAGPGFHDGPWTRAPAGVLAVESGNDIGLMDTGGRFISKLTSLLETRPNVWPDWSPDGSKIVFAGAGENGFDLYTMNADGTGVVQITDAIGDEGTPAWSPDGTRIAFAFDDHGEPDYRTGIAVVDPDGSGWTELTARENDGALGLPVWSPDGSEIVFDIFTGVDLGSRAGTVNAAELAKVDAYVMDADGGGPSLVRDDAGAVSWTPDGSRIVLSSGGSLISVRPDGSGERVIIEELPAGGQLTLDHSPDGRWFALSISYGLHSGASVYLMRVDGSELFEIGSGSEASWRPEDS